MMRVARHQNRLPSGLVDAITGDCIGFRWQTSKWGCRVGICKRHQGLLPCGTEPVLAGSKMDPLLAKAEPISDADSASEITYLRKGKKNCTTTAVRDE